jgi:ABC-type antimicrobial peptide transport system permease subunit
LDLTDTPEAVAEEVWKHYFTAEFTLRYFERLYSGYSRKDKVIRIALGVQKKEVLSLVLRQGGLLTAIGCSRGLLLALPMPRLFGATFAGFPVQGSAVAIVVFLIIGAVSIIACYISARRATKVDPMVALKYE